MVKTTDLLLLGGGVLAAAYVFNKATGGNLFQGLGYAVGSAAAQTIIGIPSGVAQGVWGEVSPPTQTTLWQGTPQQKTFYSPNFWGTVFPPLGLAQLNKNWW
jgi:hypothetical protein